MKVRFSIRNKITLVILSWVMIIGIITGTYQYFYTADATRKEWSNFVSHTLERSEKEILKELHGVAEDLFIVRDDVNLYNMLDSASEIEHKRFRKFAQKAFLSFAKNRKKYDQIRYIDESGKERVRINFDGQKAWIVPEAELQVKKGRYYFDDAFNLDVGEIFISPLDLNIEKGEIEKPFKPMLRYATPIFDSKGNKRGVVILNYLANTFLRCLQEMQKSLKDTKLILLNKEGYFLLYPDSSMEWGFMLKNDKRLQKYYPGIISQLLTDQKGSVRSFGFEFDFMRIYPILEPQKYITATGSPKAYAPSEQYIKAKDYYWILALQTPVSVIKAPLVNFLIRFVTFGAIFIFLGVIIAFWLSSRLSRPVRELRNAIENFDITKIPIKKVIISSRDEIEDLANSFNKMAKDLQRITVSRDTLTREIIERKKAEEGLIEERNRLEIITENIGVGVALISKDYRTIWANNVLHEIYGEVKGKNCYSIYNQQNDICPWCGVREVFETGKNKSVTETVGKDKHGNSVWCEIFVTPVKNSSGDIIAALEVVIPITERKKAEEELKQKMRELETFHKLAVGRELKMVELKKRVKELEKGKNEK